MSKYLFEDIKKSSGHHKLLRKSTDENEAKPAKEEVATPTPQKEILTTGIPVRVEEKKEANEEDAKMQDDSSDELNVSEDSEKMEDTPPQKIEEESHQVIQQEASQTLHHEEVKKEANEEDNADEVLENTFKQ